MKLEWTRLAIADLSAIDDWLTSNANPDIAENRLAHIREKARRLLNFPNRGPLLTGSQHYSQVEQTPYVLIYRLTNEAVQILRIRHNREDWRN